ncbi:MAG TPA: GntR family transcriptional regulator [Caldilineaceae bacterium]|nr:GntR family transcriptional regulator [Caldilineaceae bacterium]
MAQHDLTTVFAGRQVAAPRAPRYREAVYQVIKEAILTGKLQAGQPLVEEHLAALLNISRTPVREALIILEHEGIIGARPGQRAGRGLYVRPVSRHAFEEMFEANEAIEPYLVRRAALLASEGQLAEIEAALARTAACIAAQDTVGTLAASRDFHRLVSRASGNLRLAGFVVNNEERADMYLLNAGIVIDLDQMETSLREHTAIFEALARRDPVAAERLVIYHAQSLRSRFAAFFPDAEDDGADDDGADNGGADGGSGA